MLDTFFVHDKGINIHDPVDTFQIAVPLPSKRGPLSVNPTPYDFSNILNPVPVMRKQKPSTIKPPSYPVKNLKTIMEDVKKSDSETFIGELTKTQKEIVSLRNMENNSIATEFSKMFDESYESIAPLLINGNLDYMLGQNKLEYNPFLNYKEMCKYLQLKLAKTLAQLKDKC